jgi:hypothetical protein
VYGLRPADSAGLELILGNQFGRNLRKNINSGANPTIVIYNASVVNFYNVMRSLAHFENKNILFSFEKHSSLLQRWRCSCKLKKL